MNHHSTLVRRPLPAARYAAEILSTTWQRTASCSGRYLEIEYRITEPGHEGRRVWDQLLLEHTNWRAVTIAKARLDALGRAAGVVCPADSSLLIGRSLTLEIGLRKRDDTGELVNEVTGYAASDTVSTDAATTAPWRRQEVMA
ncbi:MAG: DUF669 domain-containing protein [Phycisphaerales bacterium]|nr:DUF669 domain-containing protein [Phycisphaerales bacterium]